MGFIYENNQLVDHERGIRVVDRPQMPEIPHRLELYVEEEKIVIDAIQDAPVRGATIDVTWKILRVPLYGEFFGQEDNIRKYLYDALMTYGLYGKHHKVGSIKVDFSQTKWS